MPGDWSRRSLAVRIRPSEADELRRAISGYVEVLGRGEDDPTRQSLFPVGFTPAARRLGETDRYTMADLLERKLQRIAIVEGQLDVVDDEVRIPLPDASAWRHVLLEVMMVVDSAVTQRVSADLAERMDWGR